MDEGPHQPLTNPEDRPRDVGGPSLESRELFEAVYEQLRGLAAVMLRDQRPGHTLQPTALVNEAYLKLLRQTQITADGRAPFYALAARVMRQVLVDHARGKGRDKRGGGGSEGSAGAPARRVALDDQADLFTPAPDRVLDVLALDEALSGLAALDERRARLVELRVFAGMSLDDAADALGIARSTAALDWRFSKAWLARRLGGESARAGDAT